MICQNCLSINDLYKYFYKRVLSFNGAVKRNIEQCPLSAVGKHFQLKKIVINTHTKVQYCMYRHQVQFICSNFRVRGGGRRHWLGRWSAIWPPSGHTVGAQHFLDGWDNDQRYTRTASLPGQISGRCFIFRACVLLPQASLLNSMELSCSLVGK